MLSQKDVFISTHKGSQGVKVTAIHRPTRVKVVLECPGSIGSSGLCNPNECADDLKGMALEDLADQITQHYNV